MSQNELTQEGGHFRRLYDEVLDSFLANKEDSEAKMHTAIKNILDSKNEYHAFGNRLSKLDLNDWYITAGYMYRYGPHGAGLTRCRVIEALNNCPELQTILSENILQVISLGGGPANDAIGFCTALSQFEFKGKLKILITDALPQWKTFIVKITEILKKGSFGHTSHLFENEQAELFFTSATFPTDLYHFPLHEKDIVIMCKFIHNLQDNEKAQHIQILYNKLKKSAFVLLIDARYKNISELWEPLFELLYLSNRRHHYHSGTREGRFGHNDHVKSNAQIAVLRKRPESDDRFPVNQDVAEDEEVVSSRNV